MSFTAGSRWCWIIVGGPDCKEPRVALLQGVCIWTCEANCCGLQGKGGSTGNISWYYEQLLLLRVLVFHARKEWTRKCPVDSFLVRSRLVVSHQLLRRCWRPDGRQVCESLCGAEFKLWALVSQGHFVGRYPSTVSRVSVFACIADRAFKPAGQMNSSWQVSFRPAKMWC